MIELIDPFLCEDEAKFYDEEMSRRHFSTRYNFLKSHNGFRKGNLHTFLGTSGGGKSTLMRSILLDLLNNMKGKDDFILLWLSEERARDYHRELRQSGIPYKYLAKIKFYSEIDDIDNGSKDVLKKMRWLIREKKPKIFVYDNITTSMEYANVSVPQQGDFFNELKKISAEADIPFVITAHTNGSIGESYEGMIEQNNIRGSKMPAMTSEYFYIMQSFYIDDERFNTIKITKFRGNPINHRLFEINYEPEMRIFNADKKLNFDTFKEVFKKRNKLK